VRQIFFEANEESALKRSFFRGARSGVFVEVGANAPIHQSQTWDLEQEGWTGVLIEPQRELADILRQQRKAQVFAEACSSRSNTGSRMLLHLADGHSSFDGRLNVAHVRPHGQTLVPVRTLDEILIDAGVHRIDFLSIDVEGHELEVLDGTDLARWRPRLLLVEDLLLRLDLHRYLTSRGYRWLRRTGINNWYVPEATSVRHGIIGIAQFVNKFYLGTPLRRARAAWRRHTVS
jgi:FkbM family methyltransferase